MGPKPLTSCTPNVPSKVAAFDGDDAAELSARRIAATCVVSVPLALWVKVPGMSSVLPGPSVTEPLLANSASSS